MPQPADQIAFALGRLAIFWRAAGWQAAAGGGLNPAQAEILAHLARRGPQRGGDLAAALGVSAASLSDSVASLTAKGAVARSPDPDDRRAALVALTDAGAALAAAQPAAPEALRAALAALPEAEAGALLRSLTRVIRALQQARAIPVQRLCATCRHFRPHAHDDAQAPHHCALVDAAFGDALLRIDCADHHPAPEAEAAAAWHRFGAA